MNTTSVCLLIYREAIGSTRKSPPPSLLSASSSNLFPSAILSVLRNLYFFAPLCLVAAIEAFSWAQQQLDRQQTWDGAQQKEIDKFVKHRAFKVIPIGEPIPPGYSFVRAFWLGDIKGSSTGSPELKLRFVMGGNCRPKDDIDTFLSVAHEDSPKLLFIMAYRTGQ